MIRATVWYHDEITLVVVTRNFILDHEWVTLPVNNKGSQDTAGHEFEYRR